MRLRVNIRVKILLVALLPLGIFLAVAIGIWWHVIELTDNLNQVGQADVSEMASTKVLLRELSRWNRGLNGAIVALQNHQRVLITTQLVEANHAQSAIFQFLRSSQEIPVQDRQQLTKDFTQYAAYARSVTAALHEGDLSRAIQLQLVQNNQMPYALVQHMMSLDDKNDTQDAYTVQMMINTLKGLRFQMPLIGVMAVVMSALVAWLMASGTARRLMDLTTRIQQAELGQRSVFPEQAVHAGFWSKDELQDAKYAFDQMLQTLNQTENQLHEELAYRQELLNALPIPVFFKGLDGRYLSVNTAFEQFFGAPASDLIGKSVYDISPKPLADIYYAKDQELFGNPGIQIYETQVKDSRGQLHEVIFHKATIHQQNRQVIGLIGGILDITAQKEAARQIHQLAFYDALTGLPNRTLLMDRVGQAIHFAKRHEQEFALLFLDLDHFKDVNDTLGHDVGDGLLIEVAKRLRATLREQDTICRMGGDEFILLLSDTHEGGAEITAQKVLNQIARPYLLEKNQVAVTVSIGIAIYPTHGDDLTTLYKRADIAMYQAKSAGRNRYQIFSNSVNGSGMST
jgi:diguanylate cyclase (GGDEF)-like protein/PAS domain S-box-containing protein